MAYKLSNYYSSEVIGGIDFGALYSIAIFFIIIIKISFISISLMIQFRKVAKKPSNDTIGTALAYWRGVTELIFIISMSIILIYSFYPRWTTPVQLTTETKLLFFLYGVITIITSDWDVFSP